MAKKPTVTTITTGYSSSDTLNENFEALRDGFDNTLSLDGSTPNAMEADLDLNGNNIIGADGLLINGTDYLADVTAAKTAALAAQAAAELAETNAETAETNAESSETAASSSATAAATSATAAATSATASAASAVDATNNGAAQVALAAAQVTLAETAKTAAELAETNAETAESNAATSATNAATSETNASTSASTATTKASEAATSATNAATSATESETAKTAAEAAKDAALAALDSFDDRYLGAKASDPTLDNDGNALVAGALYYNTTDDIMKVYEGSMWVAAYASLSGALLSANNLSDVTSVSSARTNLGLGTAATTASTDYATAAQGTAADAALPKAGGAMTGAITTNSTFDGRDVSVDGAKLDTLVPQTSATDNLNNRLLAISSTNGSFGLGGKAGPLLGDLDAFDTPAGLYRMTTATANYLNGPDNSFAVVLVERYSNTVSKQTFTSIAGPEKQTFIRTGNDPTWTAWYRVTSDQGVSTTDSPTFGGMNITGPQPTLLLTDNDVADEWTKIFNSNGTTYIDMRDGAQDGTLRIRGLGGGVSTDHVRVTPIGRVGIGTVNPQSPLHVIGNVEATSFEGDGSGLTNIARKVWESSQGGFPSADYWAKVATYSITGDYADGTFIYHFVPEEFGTGLPAIVAVQVRNNNASGGDSHTLNIELLAKPHAYPFSDDSFKLIDNGGTSDIELWVKKNDNYGQVVMYEMSSHVEDSGFTVAYNQNAAWQSSEPNGSGLNLKTVGVKVAGNFTANGTVTATAFAGDGSALTNLPVSVAVYVDAAGGASADSTSDTVVPVTTAEIEDTSNYSNTSGVVTVTDAGTYCVKGNVGVTCTTSNYRWTAELSIVKNGSTVVGKVRGAYLRGANGSNDSYIHIDKMLSLAASDTIQLKVKRISTASGDATFLADVSTLQLQKL